MKEENNKYESPIIIIKKGDRITSKKGFISQSPITHNWYKYHKKEYLGDGAWLIIDDKTEIDVKALPIKESKEKVNNP